MALTSDKQQAPSGKATEVCLKLRACGLLLTFIEL
jgi:hypothetical protein